MAVALAVVLAGLLLFYEYNDRTLAHGVGPRVKAGLSDADVHPRVVNNFLTVINDGPTTVTGIELELNTLPSDTFGFVKGENLTSVTMGCRDDAGRARPFCNTMLRIR